MISDLALEIFEAPSKQTSSSAPGPSSLRFSLSRRSLLKTTTSTGQSGSFKSGVGPRSLLSYLSLGSIATTLVQSSFRDADVSPQSLKHRLQKTDNGRLGFCFC